MAFKALIIATLLACVSAGGPASYAISAPSIDHYSVGSSNEHTVKGLYGQNVLSSYTKSVATPHSQAHVSLSKSSNDIGYKSPLAYPGSYAAPLGIAKTGLPYSGYYGGYPGLHGGYPGLHAGYPGLHAGYPGLHAGYPGIHAPLAVAKPAVYPYGGYHGAYPGHGALLAKPAIAAAPVLGSTVSFHGLGAHYGW